ncbi:melibiase, partial [Haematococcus lacustris]
VRDAWQQDDLGPHVALFTAHLVEPHEARVLLITFVEPTVAQQWQAQVG